MDLKNFILGRLPVRLVRRSAIRYDEDGFVTSNAAPFLEDPEFVKGYAAGQATGSWGKSEIRWRAHAVAWAVRSVSNLGGDFAECGVNRGGLARMIVDVPELFERDRRFYLLDTFKGFDPRFPPADSEHWRYDDAYDAVQKTFAPFPAVQVIRGTVPDTLADIESDRFAFVHIDMNTPAPEIAAMEFFWPKLVTGGIVIYDDYCQPGHEAQLKAHDAFARSQGFSILALPTGQGLAIKR